MKLKLTVIFMSLFILMNGYNSHAASLELNNSVVDLTETTAVSSTEEDFDDSSVGIGDSASTEEVTGDDGLTSEENGGQETTEDSSTGSGSDTEEELLTPEDILPDVDKVGFFNHLMNKLGVTLSGFQTVVAVLLMFLFVAFAFAVVICCFGQKNKIPWFLLAMIICLLMFFAVIYAKDIMAAFLDWIKYK